MPDPSTERAPVPELLLEQETEVGLVVPPPGRGLRHAVRTLRHRDFALFLAGAFVSNTGSWMQNVTVPYVLYQTTHSAAWVGFGSFAQFMPALAVGPLGGVLADRLSRKWILVATSLVGAAAALGLWAVYADGHASPWTTAALVAVTGISVGFGLPAWQAFVTQLAPRDELLSAITLNSGQFNASRAVGPALGGLVITYLSASTAFMLNALSFIAVIGVLLAIRSREPSVGRTEGRALREFRDGVSYTRRHTGLVVAVAVVGCVAFFGSPVLSLSAVLAREALGVRGDAYGLLVAAFGTGGVLGAILLSGYGDAFRRSRIMTAAVALYGVGLLGVGLSPVYGVALAGMLVLGVAYLACVSAANTSIQLLVVEHLRGRVLAIYTMAITGGIPLGALVQGWLSDRFGVREVLSGGALVLLGLAAFLAVRPALRAAVDTGVTVPEPPPSPATRPV